MSKPPNYRASGDPLKVFPTHLSQRIFGLLDIPDLAKCARVCKKWHSSQSINYGRLYFSTPSDLLANLQAVWFRRYRKENFNDESLPPGKWTRRESKQNWVRSIMVFTKRTNSLIHRESCMCNQFQLESWLVLGTQLLQPVLVVNHQGR